MPKLSSLNILKLAFLHRSIAPEKYGPLYAFSVKLALSMQIIGFSVRFCSSVLWIQMYRLGIPSFNSNREEDFDVRENFLNSNSDDTLDCFLNDSA